MKNSKVTISTRLHQAKVEELDRIAARRGVNRSELVADLIDRGLVASGIEDLVSVAIKRIQTTGSQQNHLLDEILDRLTALERK